MWTITIPVTLPTLRSYVTNLMYTKSADSSKKWNIPSSSTQLCISSTIYFTWQPMYFPLFTLYIPLGSLMLRCNYTAWNDSVLFLPAWSSVTWAREIVYCVRGYSGRLLPPWVMSTFAPCWPTGILLLPGIGVAVAIAVNMSSETFLLLTHAMTSVSMIKFVS